MIALSLRLVRVACVLVGVGAAAPAALARDRVVARVSGLDVPASRVEALAGPDGAAAARARAVDEALLHAHLLRQGDGLDAKYVDLLVARLADAPPRSRARSARALGAAVDRGWAAGVGLDPAELPPGVRLADLPAGLAAQVGDASLSAAAAGSALPARDWVVDQLLRATARARLAAGAPELRAQVVADWVEATFGPAVEAEDLVPSALRRWYEDHRAEYPEERLWVRQLCGGPVEEQARAQLLVVRAHIEADPSRFPIFARSYAQGAADAGALIGPVRPGDPGGLPAGLATAALRLGRDGLSPVLTVDGQLYLVLIEQREGGLPVVEAQVRARAREAALAARTEALLVQLRAAPGG
jgi:hypothetical protein